MNRYTLGENNLGKKILHNLDANVLFYSHSYSPLVDPCSASILLRWSSVSFVALVFSTHRMPFGFFYIPVHACIYWMPSVSIQAVFFPERPCLPRSPRLHRLLPFL